MRRPLSVLITCLVLVPTSTVSSASAASAPLRSDVDRASGTVTRSEFRAVRRGMTFTQVRRIFDAAPVCKTFDYDYGDGLRTTGYQWRKQGGRYVGVEFNNFERGRGPVRVDTKEFGVERYQCSTGTEHLRTGR